MEKEEFNIKYVENVTGVNSNTLKAWERRYEAVVPKRQKNGRRVYSATDVLRLKLLQQLVQQGHSIGSIANKTVEELRKILGHIGVVTASTAAAVQVPERSSTKTSNSFITMLREYDLDALANQLVGARLQEGVRDFILKTVVPLLVDVGIKVEKNELSIGHEHALSAIIKSELMQILYSLSKMTDAKKNNQTPKFIAIIAGIEGDQHEFGILCASILVALSGGKPFYLGPSLPASSLAEAAKRIKADLVIVGSTPLDPGVLDNPILHYVTSLDAQLPSKSDIWVGGWCDCIMTHLKRNFRHIPSLDILADALGKYKIS